MSALHCHGVRLDAGGRVILRGIDLEVASGSVCALVGESGAGKTTLLRTLAGLATPADGSVRLGGRSIIDRRPEQRRVGFVFQEPRLFPSMSVIDNVAYARRVRGESRARRRGVAQGLLDEVGLGDRGGDRPHSLSGGEQQRVALARALCADPELLLFDEPLSAVDGPRRDELRELLRRLQGDHAVTTVIVTHDVADAAALAARIAVLDDGVIAQCAPPDELFQHPSSPRVARLTGNPNVLHANFGDGASWIDDSQAADRIFTIRPEHLRLDVSSGEPMGVTDFELRGTYARVQLDGVFGRLVAHVPSHFRLRPGERVSVLVPPEHVWQFPGGLHPAAGHGG